MLLGPKNHVLDEGTYGHNLANTIELSVLSSNVGCRYHHYSNLCLYTVCLLVQDMMFLCQCCQELCYVWSLYIVCVSLYYYYYSP